jgi:hypothetical protein
MLTDYSGVLFVPYDASQQWQFDLIRELRECGYDIDANKLFEGKTKPSRTPEKRQGTDLSDEQQAFLFKLNREASKYLHRPDPNLYLDMLSLGDVGGLVIARSPAALGLVIIEEDGRHIRITSEGARYVKNNLSNKKLVADFATERAPNGKLDFKLKRLPDGTMDLAWTEYLVDIPSEKERRDAFLCKLYDFVDHTVGKLVTGVNIAANGWGYSDDEVERYANYFAGKNFLHVESAMGNPVLAVRITSFGVDYVESLNCAKLMQQ